MWFLSYEKCIDTFTKDQDTCIYQIRESWHESSCFTLYHILLLKHTCEYFIGWTCPLQIESNMSRWALGSYVELEMKRYWFSRYGLVNLGILCKCIRGSLNSPPPLPPFSPVNLFVFQGFPNLGHACTLPFKSHILHTFSRCDSVSSLWPVCLPHATALVVLLLLFCYISLRYCSAISHWAVHSRRGLGMVWCLKKNLSEAGRIVKTALRSIQDCLCPAKRLSNSCCLVLSLTLLVCNPVVNHPCDRLCGANCIAEWIMSFGEDNIVVFGRLGLHDKAAYWSDNPQQCLPLDGQKCEVIWNVEWKSDTITIFIQLSLFLKARFHHSLP